MALSSHDGFGLIGVGFDGRLESRRALALARRIAAGLGARLRIVAALPSPVRASDAATQREQLESKLEDAAAFARLPDAEGRAVDVEAVLRDGDPAEVLAGEGEELDLLVVGSRGYGPIRSTVLGSVGSDVLRSCPCPVTVVPR